PRLRGLQHVHQVLHPADRVGADADEDVASSHAREVRCAARTNVRKEHAPLAIRWAPIVADRPKRSAEAPAVRERRRRAHRAMGSPLWAGGHTLSGLRDYQRSLTGPQSVDPLGTVTGLVVAGTPPGKEVQDRNPHAVERRLIARPITVTAEQAF